MIRCVIMLQNLFPTCWCSRAGRTLLVLWLLVPLVGTVGLGADASGKRPPGEQARPSAESLAAFVRQSCLDCHAGAAPEAGLNLETLAQDLLHRDDAAGFDRISLSPWERVFDRVTAGEMPPADADQPSPAGRREFLSRLDDTLTTASRRRQQIDGRTALRRLNRHEYENTLRDLLHLPLLDVADLLPEDSVTAGFDTVAKGLGVSAVHLEQYQLAAATAIEAAVPTRPMTNVRSAPTLPQAPLQLSMTPAETISALIWAMHAFGQRGKKWRPWLENGEAIITSRNPTIGSVASPVAPLTGRYRVRCQVRGVNAGGLPLPVTLSTFTNKGAFTREDILGVHDVAADEPTEIVHEIDLARGGRVHLVPWSLPAYSTMEARCKDCEPEDAGLRALAFGSVHLEGPLDDWPGPSYRAIYDELPQVPKSVAIAAAAGRPGMTNAAFYDARYSQDVMVPVPLVAKADAERLLRRLLPRAFRRPVPDDVLASFVAEAHAKLDAGMPFFEAMAQTYQSVLCSPHFLYLRETPGRLDAFAIASRLSYFLWRSQPDERLRAAAASGTLATPHGLRSETDRLLADPKARRFVDDFTGQWLDLREIDATTPDPRAYPEYEPVLRYSMLEETRLFVAEVLRDDRSVLEFVDSDWTMLNERLCRHYGLFRRLPATPPANPDEAEAIPTLVAGGELRRVTLPATSPRGGLLTQASILKVTADGTRTSPVIRGAWVCKRILGVDPPMPPASVAKIEPDIRGATTIREQLAKHSTDASCATCHRHIDPPGFALETFDVIGGWRDFYRATSGGRPEMLVNYGRKVSRGPDVEQGHVMPDGRRFADIEEYKARLLEHPEAIVRNLVGTLVTFATGAEVQFADRPEVDRIVRATAADRHGLRSIIHAIVQSRVFLEK
jgi:hypothetical protein